MANLKRLNSRIEWKLTFQVTSPIHIGGSQEKIKNQHSQDTKAATLSLMDCNKQEDSTSLLIPGSSFRGVTRSYLERLIVGLVTPTALPFIEALYGKTGKPQSIKGRIWFSDVYIPKTASVIKNLTPIDRLTHKPLAPLSVQAIKVGTTFQLTMTIENATSEEYGLVGLLLRAFHEELIAVGSAQSRGLGRIQLIKTDTTIKQYGRKFETEDHVQMPSDFFKAQRDLLCTTYYKQAEQEQSYTWLQFGADALAKAIKGGHAHVR